MWGRAAGDPYETALNAIQRGDFDEIKTSLESVGFKFKQGSDPNHWLYFHPELKPDPHFRYPRNLYRPHGTRRSTDRIAKRDQSAARQMVHALKALRGISQGNEEEQ